jgi:hypothetical protein
MYPGGREPWGGTVECPNVRQAMSADAVAAGSCGLSEPLVWYLLGYRLVSGSSQMADYSDTARTSTAWKRVPWGMQNYIFFYLRSHHFPITAHNTEAVAQAIADRLRGGPVKHFELEVVIERSAVEYRLEEGDDGS